MFKISYSLDFLNNASFVNAHHASTIVLSIFLSQVGQFSIH